MALTPGDIAFVQYNEDSPDNFAFVTLTEIGPNEVIIFTDIGWTGVHFQNVDPNFDSAVYWSSGAATIPAGTVITIEGSNASGGGSIVLGDGLVLGSTGDQIIAFQGTFGSPMGLAQIHTNDTFAAPTFDTDDSALFSGLTLGTDAIHLLDGGAEMDNAAYTGPTTTTDKAGWLARLNDPSNWTKSTTVTQTFGLSSINVSCFAGETLISTPAGASRIDAMNIGDEVVTQSGAVVPVRWIGRQTLSTAQMLSAGMAPVRISAGALGEGAPNRDLIVTADHGMIVDGLLINASALVNGTTITWVPVSELGESFTVYHIETEKHDVILANGAPAETFVDHAGRHVFDNFQGYMEAHGAERIIVEMERPRVTSRRSLPGKIRERLDRISEDKESVVRSA